VGGEIRGIFQSDISSVLLRISKSIGEDSEEEEARFETKESGVKRVVFVPSNLRQSGDQTSYSSTSCSAT